MPTINITRPELIWPGKYDDNGNRVENRGTALPFQVIETIKEGRATREPGRMSDLFSFAATQDENNWHNKLIWGDNLLVLASLMEEYAGKVDLIYIDPPFATGSDFSYKVLVGDEDDPVPGKEPSLIEEKAYRDTWGSGFDSYLSMIAPRLQLLRGLLSETGSIFVHVDVHIGPYIKILLDEIFGKDNFQNEIAWYYYNKMHDSRKRLLPKAFDQILYYVKSKQSTFTYKALTEDREQAVKQLKRVKFEGRMINARDEDGNIIYQEKTTRTVDTVWRIRCLQPANKQEWVHYDTQKPVDLIERVLSIASKPGDLVLDCFCGSGTSLVAAEKNGRRWIACDLGKFAIHTARKRLLGIPDCKPFEILNLGKYERKYWQGLTFGETPTEPNKIAISAYIAFILELYKAQGLAGSHIHGKKGRALIHVGAVDAPVTINQVNEALAECATLGQKELHILGWEWEMGMNDPIIKHAQAEYGIGLRLLNIPREVMEKRAVECGDIRFFDLAYLEAEVKPEGKGKRSIRVELKNFVIPDTDLIPDEAHHVHDEDLAWNKTLMALHENLKTKDRTGLTLWLDFSATPKNQNGTYFPWIVVDYPLAQAVEDRIVKTPLIIHQTDKVDPDKYAHEEAGDAYNEWIAIAVERWRQHVKDYAVVGEKPLLFVMAEDTKDADSIAERLRREPEFKEKDRVLLIHTKKNGEITEKDLGAARDAARTVDKGTSRTRAIVSVLMLREGWDVRNVSVILGLRPFTAKANILPEQAIGRGLRLMRKMPRNCNQILELIGTNAFEMFIRELEKEGVGIPRVTKPKPPVQVFPLEERRSLDIRIPRTTPLYEREYRRLEELDPLALPQLAKEKDLDREIVNRIDLVHGIVNIRVASDEIEFNAENVPPIENLLSSLTSRVERKAKLTGRFAELYPKVREYVRKRCFGGTVELDDVGLRRALNHSGLLDAIAGMFGRKIGELTATLQPVKLTGNDYLLSETEPFLWRRMITHAERTIFNVVPCYNEFEASFAAFLNGCDDIDRFAALAEWFTKFHVQYLSLTGSIRLYYPDFVAVQTTLNGDVHWILETKGREFEETTSKDFHMARWCEDVSSESGESWRYLKVQQTVFDDFIRRGDYRRFEALLGWNSNRQGVFFESEQETTVKQ